MDFRRIPEHRLEKFTKLESAIVSARIFVSTRNRGSYNYICISDNTYSTALFIVSLDDTGIQIPRNNINHDMPVFKSETTDKIRLFLGTVELATIDQVAVNCGINWRTAKRYLEHLAQFNLIGSCQIGGVTCYATNPGITIHRVLKLEDSNVNDYIITLIDSLESLKQRIAATIDDLVKKARQLLKSGKE